MNEKDLQVAIDKLVAIGEFSRDLVEKLTFDLNLIQNPVSDLTPDEVKSDLKESFAKGEPLVTPSPAILARQQDDAVDLDDIADKYELKDMKIGELREYLDGYEIDYPDKAKKADLVAILAQAIVDGIVPVDEEEEPATDDVVAPATEDASAVDDTSSEDDVEVSDERISAEDKVEDTIRASFPKKLKVSVIKKFLKTYYDGDPEMADLDSFDEEELLDMYVEIKRSLVDDDGEVHDMEDPYYRNGVIFCCGKETVEMEDSENVYCTVCANEYGD